MPSRLNPYINFAGQARSAIEFYHSIFGGNLSMVSYKDGGTPHAPADADKIMHAMLVADNGMMLMAADSPPEIPHTPGNNISISLSGENGEELTAYWKKLSSGATIGMPLDKAPWGDTFGMLTDKFGIGWMVNIVAQQGG
jgi:PhnB protein